MTNDLSNVKQQLRSFSFCRYTKEQNCVMVEQYRETSSYDCDVAVTKTIDVKTFFTFFIPSHFYVIYFVNVFMFLKNIQEV